MRRPRVARYASVAVVVAVSGSMPGSPGRARPSPTGGPLPEATSTVTRGDLVDTITVDGTLGYGGQTRLVNGASGTVTGVRADGTVVRRGETLYRVDDDPVTLMYGTVPLYRPLSEGVDDGRDVKEIEWNLAALGYGDDMTVDRHFTSVTDEAIRDWQHDRGLPRTGRIDAGQVIVAPEPVRVTSTKVLAGARIRPGQVVLTATGTRRRVEVALDTSDQQFARTGAPVAVRLPTRTTVSGRISRVGRVATAKTSSNQTTTYTITVDIVLDHPKRAAALDQAPVSVDLQSERHEDVLSVPVEALLALKEGGYGVRLVQGRRARVVAVTTGLFAKGRVEVSGPGLTDGTVVGVPAR